MQQSCPRCGQPMLLSLAGPDAGLRRLWTCATATCAIDLDAPTLADVRSPHRSAPVDRRPKRA